MTKKNKEEERIGKIIRGLLKIPENIRCVNCNSLGPQYVCTTFFTFVCKNCSGIHLEFTHRVKSISMAKFNAEEVSALQAGGNERARQIFLKEWNPQRNQLPDSSNQQKVRDFIKHVYVDRRYTGEKSHEKLPRLRLNDKEDSGENRWAVLYSGGSRSPNYEDRHGRSERSGFSGRADDKTIKYYYDERRSPRYSQENSRYGGFMRSPVRFEVVDDRFRDDGIRSSRQSGVHPFAHRESRFGNKLSDIQKDMHQSGSHAPVVRPLKHILGGNIPPLQVGEHSKAPNMKDADGSARNQMPPSSGPMESADGNPVQQISHNSESSVDLNSNSKSSDASAALPAQENLLSSEGGNCSSHDSSGKKNALPAPKQNTLEFLLLELAPSVIPSDKASEIPTNDNPSSAASGENIIMSSGASAAGPSGQMLTLQSSAVASAIASGGNMPAASVSQTVPVEQMSALPCSAGASTAVSGGTMPVGSISPAAPVVQTSTASGISPAVHVEEILTLVDAFDASTIPSNNSLPAQPSNGVPPLAALDNSRDSTFEVLDGQQISTMQQQQPVDSSSAGQQATKTPAGVVNDQGSPDFLGEYLSQDVSKPAQESNSEAQSQPLPSETKSSGRKELPADLFTGTYSPAPDPIPGCQICPPYGMGFNMQYYPNAMFPSMGNLHGTLPVHTSAMPPHSLSFASAMPYGGYMGQQADTNLPHSRPHGPCDFGSEGVPFGSLNMAQQPTGGYLLPTSSSSLRLKGGNPFG
uniref:Arf-GAP domain-containing protein n=1 Tax=Populus trichocarpa TaxID=3694 RepID=A0A2K2A7Q5_POPTR